MVVVGVFMLTCLCCVTFIGDVAVRAACLCVEFCYLFDHCLLMCVVVCGVVLRGASC